MPGRATPALRAWSRGERFVVAAGVLLAADLAFLPWHRIRLDRTVERFGVQVPSFRLDRTGLQDPNALLGIAALVVALAMVAHVLATRLHAALRPAAPAQLVGGAVVLGLVVAKLLAHNKFLGPGAWAGLVLAGGVAFGGYLLAPEFP